MKVLHLVPSVGKRAFGLGLPPRYLARYQQASGIETQIWTVGDNDLELQNTVEETGLRTGSIMTFRQNIPLFPAFSRDLLRCLLSEKGRDFSAIHLHGVWTWLSYCALRWGTATGRPVIVAAQGALQPWALKKSSWKKKLALGTYEGRNLAKAACLHAVADAEIADYRQCYLTGPVAVIPNGVDEAWLNMEPDIKRFRHEFGLNENKRLALFLSRITPKKGLPMFIEAVDRLRGQVGNWVFVIAGEDEFDHRRDLENLIYRKGLSMCFQFVGPLYGRQKRDAFAAADLFVLPTYSEGAPAAILEALGAGLPVLTTKGAPWPQLVEQHCGWWTEINVGAVQIALADAVSKPMDELRAMGARGRELVRREYLWSESAVKTIRLYEWLLGGGTRPAFVHLD